MGGEVTGGEGEDMEGGDDCAEEEGDDDGAEEGGSGDELDVIVVISVEGSEGTAMEDSLDIVDGTCTGDDGDSKIQSAVVRQWESQGRGLDSIAICFFIK